MKIITNNQLIKRNRLIGKITTYVSLGILASGLLMSFSKNPETDMMTWSLVALVVGFLLSQVGLFFGSRWGKSPRPDEKITAALKGLDDKYTLYHYTSPVSHLLTGPAGFWILLPYAQSGTILYDEKRNRWIQKGGNLYLKMFAQESLGRPDMDIVTSQEDIQRLARKNNIEQVLPHLKAVLVFTNPKTVVQVENAPTPTLPADKLKEFIRKQVREKPAAPEQILLLTNILPLESIS